MTGRRKPAILIVHDAYTKVISWDSFTFLLIAAQYRVKCPQLPSSNKEPVHQKSGMKEDIAIVRSATCELIERGEEIIVLAHSQGGQVASAAITEDLYYSPETGAGVKHLIYLCTYLSPLGISTMEILEKYKDSTKLEFAVEGGVARTVNTALAFYNDMDLETAKAAAKEHVYQSVLSFQGEPRSTPWKDLPSTYIFCEKDQIIFLSAQEAMVEEVKAAGAKLKTLSMNCGHSPFLSRKIDLFEIVKNIADRTSEDGNET